MSQLYEEIQSVALLRKSDGTFADAVFQPEQFASFEPTESGMVKITTAFNSSKEYLLAGIDYLLRQNILVVQ